jgi:SAM-dependent methyltransferase
MTDNLQRIRNFIFFPLRCLFPNNEYIGFLRVTPLSQERFHAVKPYLEGKVLDLGCGDNRLIKEYRLTGGVGVGADLASKPQADFFLTAGEPLPFTDAYFNTITVVASLNHIPDRERVLRECYRCLAPGGHIVITVLGKLVGGLGHFLWARLGSDADLAQRESAEGERGGMSKSEVYRILEVAGFTNIRHHIFTLGLNNLYVAERSY